MIHSKTKNAAFLEPAENVPSFPQVFVQIKSGRSILH